MEVKADRLPGLATVKMGEQRTRLIKILLRRPGCFRDPSEDCESETMDRLLEHSARQAVAR